ncbi:MAG TPA: GNAT family N-acetyltransferase [Caulobacteraceae bacterium]|nr:GNAT family N-acetyltransferase [Caulobacteraceae bacterium]HUO12856.1 GNAT family N-acetyltransferase [Caulobacteraceae bacterium]
MAKADIIVRAVEPEDWPDIGEIHDQPNVIAGTLQMPFRSKAFHRKRGEERPANALLLGAVIDGKLIGTAGLTRLENRRSHVGTIGMAVHDAYAGRGAGGALMAALLTMADRWMGLRRVELTVYADNTRAIGLYERFGFEREGLHRDFALRDGRFVDALAMARLI